MRLGLLFFTFCGYPIVLLAQNNYLFHHLTLKDGLESEFVRSVFQDSKEYYWVGTTSGLQKFDGYSFSKFLKAGKDLLSSSTVTETRDGTLWISNGSSLYRYNRANEQFIPVTPEGEKPIMNLRVIEDSAGNIWLLNDKALYKYDLIAKKPVNWLKLPASSPALTAGAIAFKKEACLIRLQKGTTLYTISPGKKRIIKEEKMPFQAAQLWTDGDYLWLSLWNQTLCRYNILTGQQKWFTLPFTVNGSPVIDLAVANCFARDKTGRLWIGSVDGGMWYLDERTNKFVRLKPDNYKSESFHFNDMVYSITKGMLAPQAAAVIHTDFEKGFIRAEVIKYDDFIKYETEAVCRDNGKLAVQGKDYLVEDGDIMHFRFNV